MKVSPPLKRPVKFTNQKTRHKRGSSCSLTPFFNPINWAEALRWMERWNVSTWPTFPYWINVIFHMWVERIRCSNGPLLNQSVNKYVFTGFPVKWLHHKSRHIDTDGPQQRSLFWSLIRAEEGKDNEIAAHVCSPLNWGKEKIMFSSLAYQSLEPGWWSGRYLSVYLPFIFSA